MDKQLLRSMAIHSFSLMLIVMITAFFISLNNQSLISADDSIQTVKANKGEVLVNSNQTGNERKFNNSSLPDELGNKYIIIKKNNITYKDIDLQDLYMKRSINISLNGIDKEFDHNSIFRFNNMNQFSGYPEGNEIVYKAYNLVKSDDPVKAYSFEYSEDKSGTKKANITIQLDDIYAPKLYQDDNNIYIDLRNPKDVYNKIIVVDAGHGGTDPGTFSKDEQHYEKDLNLSILLYLKDLLDKEDIKVYYTRTSDETVYLNPRVYLANDVDADYFISIHCNASELTSPSGAEVLYNNRESVNGINSKQFAQICLEEITKITKKVNRGIVLGDDIVIIDKAKMPISLIEVGFMSNQDELNFLLQEDNKRKIANGIYKAILRAYNEN